MAKDIQQRIKDAIETTMAKFLYYDRKEDEDLPVDAIENAVKDGKITVNELVDEFAAHLESLRKL